MKNIAIFASGNGSNFEAIVNANLSCNITVLICNNKNAYALKRAEKLNIKYEVVDFSDYENVDDYEKEISVLLNKYEIDLIVLAGYMKIFSKSFVEKYEGKIINIHPSKLPAYQGLDAVKRAFFAGETEIGVSVHYVDSGVDTGHVIACEVICVDSLDTLDTIYEKVHMLEHQLYPKVLEGLI